MEFWFQRWGVILMEFWLERWRLILMEFWLQRRCVILMELGFQRRRATLINIFERKSRYFTERLIYLQLLLLRPVIVVHNIRLCDLVLRCGGEFILLGIYQESALLLVVLMGFCFHKFLRGRHCYKQSIVVEVLDLPCDVVVRFEIVDLLELLESTDDPLSDFVVFLSFLLFYEPLLCVVLADSVHDNAVNHVI